MYRYRIWCKKCSGVPEGCFGGGTAESKKTFETPELADEDGYDATKKCAPWMYEVIDESGDVVELKMRRRHRARKEGS